MNRNLIIIALALPALALSALAASPAAAGAGDSLAVRFVHAFGSEGDAPGQFRAPRAISLGAKGALYVADTGNNRLQKFSANGELLEMTGGFGWGEDQMNRPVDLAAENGLDLFVADYENRRLLRYDSDLHWIEAYSYPGEEDAKLALGFPAGLATSIHGDLFAADAENLRILKINALREALFSFGDYAEGEGGLDEPQKIAIDSSDRLYVCDPRRGAVLRYDYYGNFLGEVGHSLLKEPAGLCVDRKGHLFIADSGLDQVLVFSLEGALLGTIGRSGTKYGAMDDPADVASDDGRLYVIEAGNHRIQVFELLWLPRP